MLTHLTIKNYALIRHLELTPSEHLNVITGETGAGKSIMLGAIGLLTGNRADTKVLWDENQKCITEGVFDIKPYGLKNFFKTEDLDYDDRTVIRREISPGGKSRAFINDTPVTLEVLKKLGSRLMDIHSQHETLELGSHAFQLKLVDGFAGNDQLRNDYLQAWQNFTEAKLRLENTEKEAGQLKQEADYISFQLDELIKAALDEAEQEHLESELKIAEHAEEIKSRFNTVLDLLGRQEYAAQQRVKEARQQVQQVASFSKEYEALYQRLQGLSAELADVLREIERVESQIEFDPQRAREVTERLDLIYRLQKKHRVNTVAELLTLQRALQEKAGRVANLDEVLEKVREEFNMAQGRLATAAAYLSRSRQAVFYKLCSEITNLLRELGIPDATLAVDHKTMDPGQSGADRVDILFSANKGIAPRPLAQVASGGEFSRLMFCIKYVMAGKTQLPTLILDEIDSGVSGETAVKLGRLMRTMAKKHQLLAITHLPQLAAKAHAHYYVFKDSTAAKTVSGIKLLTDEERVTEIAKMIGGEKPSNAALENARELLV